MILNITIHYLPKTLQLRMRYHPIKFGCKKISSSVDIIETVMLDYTIPQRVNVTLTLNIANQFYHMTLWPMMLFHHTKFGYKRFSS